MSTTTEKDGQMWFHEDEYCQIQLLPAQAADFANQQTNEMIEWFKTHKSGFISDIFVRQESPITLNILAITLDDLAACVPAALSILTDVTSGTHSDVAPAENTVVWTSELSCSIFADFNAEKIIEHVWFAQFGFEGVPIIRQFFSACAQRWDLILADWGWEKVVALRDDNAVEEYFYFRRRLLI